MAGFTECQAKSQAASSSAAAGGAVSVAGTQEIFEELRLGGNRELGMMPAEVLDMRVVVRHSGDASENTRKTGE
jgi:hypothetical protein